MKRLDKAVQLTQAPITLESFLEWERLHAEAQGEEAELIGDLYDAMLAAATDEVYEVYMEHLANRD
ncbi:hypothetical protein [Vibrio sp.]|uniref:hypothetical protein n=1 Tax=Vibrio sp. TaxID=678 RepID=UPI003D0E9D25